MKEKIKLTPPQENLLYELREEGPKYVHEKYQPALKLVELGYAQWDGPNLVITRDGRKRYTRDESK